MPKYSHAGLVSLSLISLSRPPSRASLRHRESIKGVDSQRVNRLPDLEARQVAESDRFGFEFNRVFADLLGPRFLAIGHLSG